MTKNILPGLRNIKTALSVVICALLFNTLNLLFGLPNINYFYSAIASVVTIQQTIDDSVDKGVNRILGTFTGGLVSLIMGSIYTYLFDQNFEILFLFISIVITIHAIHKFKLNGGVPVACIVVIATFSIKTDVFIPFVFARTTETAIGVVIGLFVNKYIFPYNPKNKKTEE